MVAVHEGLGQNLSPIMKGGKSGLRRVGCSVTRSPGDGKESATENIPPRIQFSSFSNAINLLSTKEVESWVRGKGEKAR
jgi:hypothetical protein